MSENKRRLISLLMAVAMLFSMMPMGVNAVEQPDAGQEDTEQTQMQTMSVVESVPEITEQTEPEREVTALELGVQQDAAIENPGEWAYFSFTPSQSGEYYFISIAVGDTKAELYDDQWNLLGSDDDSGDANNFKLTWELTAGNTYYYAARFFDAEATGTFPVVLKRTKKFSIAFEPITVMEGEYGSLYTAYNEETGKSDVAYFRYEASSLLQETTYTVTITDDDGVTTITGSGDSFAYDGETHWFSCWTEQDYDHQWTAGNTYQINVSAMGATAEVPVTITESPLESISFTPIRVIEGTCGNTATGYNPETGNYDAEFYYYDGYYLVEKSTYTATFSDGTVLTGKSSGFDYAGQWYGFNCLGIQSYADRWTAGNTYSMYVSVMGQTVEVPVTITEKPQVSIEFAPISVEEGTCGGISRDYNEETGEYDLAYFRYDGWSLLNQTSYTVTITEDDTVTTITGYRDNFPYNGEIYWLSCWSDQSYTNQWTGGNTYKMQVSVMGTTVEVPVTITESPIESISFTPISVAENTAGQMNQDYGTPEYYYYNEYNLLNRSTYTVTFSDGTEQTGQGSSVYYNGQCYDFSAASHQNYEDQWTLGNTYTLTVAVAGQIIEVPVTIVDSPLLSVSFTPISVMEGTNGTMTRDWDPELDQETPEYYCYDGNNLLNNSTYTATFSDGTVVTGQGSYIDYNGESYRCEGYTDQSYTQQWTAGNTYSLTVKVAGKTVEVPVTITESPLVSLTVEPITVVENKSGYDHGVYFDYSWENRISYTATFRDGTVVEGDGWWLYYKDMGYSISTSDDQGWDNPWTVGNTYTGTVSIMGITVEVPVTVVENPVASVSFDTVVLVENEEGGWYWDEYGRYFDYDWSRYIPVTVTFKDGTVLSSQNGMVEYGGEYYEVTNCSDAQSGENPWLVGNTYSATVEFEGKTYEVLVEITSKTEDNGFTYLIQGGKAIITGCTLKTEILQIPETIEGCPVVGITSLDAAGPGMGSQHAKEIRIPDSVTMISGRYVLTGPSLEKIILGSGMSYYWAHEGDVPNLKHIEVSKDNPYLCSVDGVLYDKALTTLLMYPPAKTDLHVMPDSVTEVDIDLLTANANIQLGAGVEGYRMIDGIIYNADMTAVITATAAATGSYVMPETVKEIGRTAFKNSKLTDVTVSPNVTEIIYEAFSGSIALESITIPVGLELMWGWPFAGCDNLKKVNITDLAAWCQIDFGTANPLQYAHDLYLNGELITDLVIPEVVETVYTGAFMGGSMTSVTVPSSVKSICENAFQDSAVKTITFSEGLTSISALAFRNTALKTVDLPDSLEWISSDVFLDCQTLESVTFGKNLSHIGSYAFKNTGLKSVALPDSLTEMGYNAFGNCRNLENLTIGSGLTNIPASAFHGTALKTVTLPKQVEYVGESAFANSALTEVVFDCDEVYIGPDAFAFCPLGDLEFGDNVKQIDDGAFAGTYATQVKLPDSVTQISYRVFAFNDNLVSVTIPETVTSINAMAFEGDENLSHVLYKGTQEQWNALWDLSYEWGSSKELLNATVHYEAAGDEVTTEQDCTTVRFFCTICDKWETVKKGVSTHVFINGVCDICGYGSSGDNENPGDNEIYWEYETDEAAGSVTITGYTGPDTDVTVPEQIDGLPVTAFTTDTFSDNIKLTEVTLPNSVTQIAYGAFAGCTALESVAFGDKLTQIGDYAFANCRRLKNVSLPENMTHIGAGAFYRCNLEQIRIPNGITEISDAAFAGCSLTEIFIPDTVTTISYEAFANSGVWGDELTLEIPASVKEIKANAFDFGEEITVTLLFKGDRPEMDGVYDYLEATAFYYADAKGWDGYQSGMTSFFACAVPQITKQPEDIVVEEGETAVAAAEAYGQRLRYQWYYAAPGSDSFEAIGGDSIELSMVIDDSNAGGRAYCQVTDVMGQTASTNTITFENPYVGPNGIRINKLPYTLEYALRQALRIRGLEVVLTYTNGDEETVSDFEVSGYDPNVGGEQTVTVTYGDFTASFTVNVNEQKLNFAHQQEQIEISAESSAVEADAQLVIERTETELPEELQENEAVIFDITLQKDGQPVQPNGEVEVSIPVPDHMRSKCCKVYHIDDEGNATDMKAHYRDGRMVFRTDHFSYYAVVETEGVSVSGAAADGVTVELVSGGEVLETVLSADGIYEFENVTENDYQIRVSKENYVTRTYDITVAAEDLNQDVEIHLLGDVNGDGRINVIDVNKANSHAAKTKLLEGYALACADVNGDGRVNITDVNKINAHVANKKLLW